MKDRGKDALYLPLCWSMISQGLSNSDFAHNVLPVVVDPHVTSAGLLLSVLCDCFKNFFLAGMSLSLERSAFCAVCFDYVLGIRSDSDLWRTVFEFLSVCVTFIFYLGPAGRKSSQNIQRCCNARFRTGSSRCRARVRVAMSGKGLRRKMARIQ